MLKLRLGAAAVVTLLTAVLAAPGQEPANKSTKNVAPQRGALQFDVDSILKQHDRNGDGYLQRDELPRRLRDRFDELDTNHDGKLSREELRQGIVHLQPRHRASDVVFVLVEMSGHDADSVVELQQMYDMLRRLDANRDGKIDADKLKAMRHSLLKERVEGLIEDLDVNHDGKISREEARGRIKEHFDKIDTNHDGFVDSDELLRAAAEPIRWVTRPPAPAQAKDRKP
jgi:Ca2+-binding EF-hand superfamily protein